MSKKSKKLASIYFIFILVLLSALPFASQAADKESTYDRVIRTGTIRCGYTSAKPVIYIDQKDQKIKGIAHDVIEEIAKRLSLKVEWTEEVGWGNVIHSLTTDRFDIACGSYWPNGPRAREADFTVPMYYAPSFVWHHKDTPLNISSYDEINKEKYVFAEIDGTVLAHLRTINFPNSSVKSLPELSPISDVFEDLRMKKANFAIVDSVLAQDYLNAHKGEILPLLKSSPLGHHPVTFLLPVDNYRFKTMIDTMMREIDNDGTLTMILKKHDLNNIVMRNPRPR